MRKTRLSLKRGLFKHHDDMDSRSPTKKMKVNTDEMNSKENYTGVHIDNMEGPAYEAQDSEDSNYDKVVTRYNELKVISESGVKELEVDFNYDELEFIKKYLGPESKNELIIKIEVPHEEVESAQRRSRSYTADSGIVISTPENMEDSEYVEELNIQKIGSEKSDQDILKTVNVRQDISKAVNVRAVTSQNKSSHENQEDKTEVKNLKTETGRVKESRNSLTKSPGAEFICERLMRPLSCKCGMKFSRSGNLMKHMWKTGHVSMGSKEEICKSEITETNNLDGITETKNLHGIASINKVIKCDDCPGAANIFSTPGSLRRHKKRIHEFLASIATKKEEETENMSPEVKVLPSKNKTTGHEGKIITCDQCNKIFSTPGSLRRHIASIHNEVKTICPICRQEVVRLDNHLMQHQEATNCQKCQICQVRVDERRMARHLRQVHMGCQVRCLECDKFVTNIHQHSAKQHPLGYSLHGPKARDHKCACIFFQGPAAYFIDPLMES